MSFENPTFLRIGMTGTVAGKSYRVVGRLVMGMDDGGETYYWNEFNLQADDGRSATLVYEEAGQGGQWRLFTMFEPEYPMTAQDAASKHVDDPLNLEGADVRVTLVDESRVYHIEGEAPEGVEVGDVAHYFNAESGSIMIVVSWTGNEIEFYRGADLTLGTVASAFGLRNGPPISSSSSFLRQEINDTLPSSQGLVMKLVGAFLVLTIAFASYTSCGPASQHPAVVKMNAPVTPFAVGSMGALDGRSYSIRGHTIVEIAQVGSLRDRHEYLLVDDEGKSTLLVFGLSPTVKDCVIFKPMQPLNALTPQQAAALRVGDSITLDGYTAQVTELFQSTVSQTEVDGSPDLKAGAISFGLSATSGGALLLARWNKDGITFHQGTILSARNVAAAFKLRAQR